MYKISKLSNNIRVVTEQIDYVKSVSLGVWIGAGSGMETKDINGVSHYIEHMLFKGTKSLSAKQIAEKMDSVGGQINAITSKEYTCYYTKTLTEHTPLAIDLLSDMILNSAFLEESIETERRVILEEINMCEDTPEDLIHDCLSKIMWRDNPLGFPIAGDRESLNKITKNTMVDYMEKFYCGQNMVISVVGNFNEDEILRELESKFGSVKENYLVPFVQEKVLVRSDTKVINKDIEQCHLCLGFEGFCRTSPKYYSLVALNSVFGGNMSSRLFQKVREEAGLAYSIYSYANTYQKNGSHVIYAGLNPRDFKKALFIINQEIKRLKSEKLSKNEIKVAKEQMRSSVAMGLETMSARMSHFGKSLLFEDRIRSIEDTIKLIDEISAESVATVTEEVFDRDKLNIAVCSKDTLEKGEIEDIFEF